MNPNPFILKPLSLAIVLACAVSITACTGGVIRFDGGSSAQVSVDESTAGIFWKTSAQVEGQANTNGLVYKLSGTDAAQFSINSASGEMTFKQPADFEAPLDADKNNDYVVDIEASINGQSATQNVHIQVRDVSKPVIYLVKPKLNENVGKGDSVEVETRVRFYDAESNTPLKGSGVTLNTSPLIQDTTDPQLWKGNIVVPEGGVNISLAGMLSDNTPLKSSAKLFNKRDAINPAYLAVNPGVYLGFLDPYLGVVGKLNLVTHVWSTYVRDPYLQRAKIAFDFDSGLQFIFAIDISSQFNALYAFGVGSGAPTTFSVGCLAGVVNITYENVGKRVLVLTKNIESGVDKYKLLAFATDAATGLVGVTQPLNWCNAAAENVVWNLPSDVIRGTFKNFNYNRVSKTYIVADERTTDGAVVTVIQGFSETGEKRFEAQVGPDISNLAVNQADGIVYVAEHHSSNAGKIKTINIATGEVGDLVQFYGESAVGAFTDLRMDNVNKRLYVGDDVSDSIFEVDLTTNTMSELVYAPGKLRN